jgi:hypothetical protein
MINVRVALAGLAALVLGAPGAQYVHAADETPAAVIALSSNCLMGGTAGGRWVKAGEMAGMLKGGERYSVYGVDSIFGSATGEKPKPMAPEGEPCREVREVAVKPTPGKEASLAIGGQWNALPRPVRKVSNSNRTYVDMLRGFLKQNGIPSNDAQPSQTLLADLDGDGTIEVLIGATKFREARAQPPKRAIIPPCFCSRS